jgi:hypothetical protein
MIWIVLSVLAIVIGFFLGKKLFFKQQQLVEEKKAALTLAVELRSWGLVLIPQLFEDFAVGNIVDLFKQIKNLATIVKSGSDAIKKELLGVYDRVLDAQLKTPEGLALLKAKINAVEKK